MKSILKLVGPALIVGGLVLLYFAYEAHNSASGQFTSFVTGDPSDKALKFGIGRAICLLLGLGGAGKGFLGGKK